MRFPSGAAIAAFFLFFRVPRILPEKNRKRHVLRDAFVFHAPIIYHPFRFVKGVLKKISVFFRPSLSSAIDKFRVLAV